MVQELICELNLALIPEADLADQHISLSRQMAKIYPTVIELNGVSPRLAFTPHLTLYQVPIRSDDIAKLYAALADVTAKASACTLEATAYAYNANEASFEVRYETGHELMLLQDSVVAAVNPLRGKRLLERDPAGHKLIDLVHQVGIVGDNIRNTGFDAIGDPARGGLFHPHVTINWFEPGTSVEMNAADWPNISSFDGRFVALGIYVLGPYGTCAQRLARLEVEA